MNKEEKKKHPGGRPTKYKPEYAEKLIKFFDHPLYRVVVDKHEKETLVPERPATLERFAFELRVTHKTLTNWAYATRNDEYVNPEFLLAYEICKEKYAANIQEGGLMGVYAAGFAGKAATNIMDWREKQSVDVVADVAVSAREISADMDPIEAARLYTDQLK